MSLPIPYRTDLVYLVLSGATREDALRYFKKNHGMSGYDAYTVMVRNGLQLPRQNQHETWHQLQK